MDSGAPSLMPAMGTSRSATPSSLNPDGTKRTKICVYCGASPGKDPAYMEAARELARAMAKNNISLGRCPPLAPTHTHTAPKRLS